MSLVKGFGFRLERVLGSHHTFRHAQLGINLNLQPEGKDAKAYQIKQLLEAVERLSLSLEE